MGNVADYASAVAKWVGGRVKDVREARGWTQEALASALTQAGHPISRVGVAKTESATRPVTIEDIAALAKTLEVPVTHFFPNGTTESTDEVDRLNEEWLASQATESSLDDMERIALNIARLRKRAGMSQEALARAMAEAGEGHWRQTTVSRVERGKQELHPGEMAALGGILGGDVMAGTHFSKTMRGVVSSAMRGATRRELAKIERSLRDALDALEGLRKVYEAEDEDSFARD